MNEDLLFFLSAFCIIVTFLITGCRGLKAYSDFEPPDTELSEYRALEIADLETEIPDVPQDALTKIPDEVANLLASKRDGFEEVERGAIDDVPAEETLVLIGTITDYQSGRDVESEGGSIKFGEAALSIQLSLVEEATGREISTGNVSGFSSIGIGLFRGGLVRKGIYEKLAKEIVKFISDNYN
ncbi:MAG TPA: hypothetical protein VHT73_05670 [Thermodesulfobacteriota bacterium]|nr:hypothetical protein [Thermodesulfobacteriota bacterium]